MGFLDIALPIVYIVVGCVLVWFVVELALTIRKTRTTVDQMQKQITPTLENVEKITTDVAPRVDPLMERVSLTMDAANLEIMRVDEILENVTQITGTANKAVDAVDNIANAPLNLVSSLADKFRGKVTPKKASEESIKMGKEKAERNKAADEVSEAMLKGIDDDLNKPTSVNDSYVTFSSEAPASTEAPVNAEASANPEAAASPEVPVNSEASASSEVSEK